MESFVLYGIKVGDLYNERLPNVTQSITTKLILLNTNIPLNILDYKGLDRVEQKAIIEASADLCDGGTSGRNRYYLCL